ncbi:MAG: triose-phosphate isomerase [Pseudomonadota bacterium]
MLRYVIANWKMHGTLINNETFISAMAAYKPTGVEVGICVPAPYLFQLQQLCEGTECFWGAQDVSEHFEGAYTGEISVDMLQDFNTRYVIIGHSERRQYHAESSGTVARKLDRVMQTPNDRLVPIVCIGEHLSERQDGEVEAVLSEQLDPVISVLKLHPNRLALVAYEPVWAIGTGVVATPAEVVETHTWIAKYLYSSLAREVPLLYGGSVKADNAGILIDLPHVNGFLVGGASLKAETFKPLLDKCAI